MLSWIMIALGVWVLIVAANNVVFPFIKKLWPNAIPSVVTDTVAKVDDYADIMACMSANFAITAVAKKRGNTALAAETAAMRVTIAKLADETV